MIFFSLSLFSFWGTDFVVFVQGLFDSKNNEEFVSGELQNISDSSLKLYKLNSSKKRKLKL